MASKIYTIDAANKPLGRLASQIATLLIGKHKTGFVPYKDLGDIVLVKNIEKIKFTGKKLEQKKYYHHTGYPGGLKTKKLKELFEKNPKEVLIRAVSRMLPKNKLRKFRIKRLKFIP
ncbi:MAG: 50S ribosomal protein L13 [Patescibacteria group bacterium]|nr:50S ribosomal protein L13 [Patescibacteria group bacterium]